MKKFSQENKPEEIVIASPVILNEDANSSTILKAGTTIKKTGPDERGWVRLETSETIITIHESRLRIRGLME